MNLAGVVLPLALYSGLNYGDYRTSRDAQRRSIYNNEVGVLPSMIGLTPAKVFSTAALTTADLIFQKDKHKATVWTFRGGVAAMFIGVMIHNSRSGVYHVTK